MGYKGVIERQVFDAKAYLQNADISTERILQLPEVPGVFYKETSKIKSKKTKEEVIEEMVAAFQSPGENIEGREEEIVRELFETGIGPHNNTLYARDIEKLPVGLPPYLSELPPIGPPHRKKIKGVDNVFGYFAYDYGNTAFHDEDKGLNSINLHIGGHPKVWLIIDHTMRIPLMRAFETHLKKNGVKNVCPQHLHHKLYVLTPSLLTEWGINFALFTQNEGDMVVVRGSTFHFVISKSASFAVATNNASLSWNDKIDVDVPVCKCKESLNHNVERDRAIHCVQIKSGVDWKVCTMKNCNFRFKFNKDLKIHLKNVHNKRAIKLLNCNDCNERFDKKSDLIRHVQVHAEVKDLKTCHICQKRVQYLTQHLRAHQASYKKECPKCKVKITVKRFANHLNNCQTVCDICDKQFTSSRYVNQHKKLAHSI